MALTVTDWLLAMQRDLAPCECPQAHAGTDGCVAPAQTAIRAGGKPAAMCLGCAAAAEPYGKWSALG